jgi:hypothetical protein
MVESISASVVNEWCATTAQGILLQANELKAELRDFASTLLMAVVGEQAAAFVQVGDGGIVILDDAAYRPVFWPRHGEYVNTTNFVTDDNVSEAVCFELLEKRIDEVALFTDGMESLVLELGARQAHQPFFAPLFGVLRDISAVDELVEPFSTFLDSPTINERTDDDRTLILATRIPDDACATRI